MEAEVRSTRQYVSEAAQSFSCIREDFCTSELGSFDLKLHPEGKCYGTTDQLEPFEERDHLFMEMSTDTKKSSFFKTNFYDSTKY